MNPVEVLVINERLLPVEVATALHTARSAGLGRGPLIIVLAGMTSGCDNNPSAPRTAHEAYLAAPEVAHAALKASLQAWLDGHPRGPASVGGIAVDVSDSDRDPSRPLAGFEILGPIGGDDLPRFAVRLRFGEPADERVVRYLVLGRNPIWVFRQEDYDRISHWEHKMEQATDESDALPTTPPDPPLEPQADRSRDDRTTNG